MFQLPVPTVVYECLVQDTPSELRPLFYWLGLDWPVPKASLPWAVPPNWVCKSALGDTSHRKSAGWSSFHRRCGMLLNFLLMANG